MCINLPNKFQDNAHHDDHSRARNEEILGAQGRVLGEDERNDGDNAEEHSAPEVEAVTRLCEDFRCGFSRPDAGDKPAALLNILRNLLRTERDGDVEVRGDEHEEEVRRYVERGGIVSIELGIDEVHDPRKTRRCLQKLRNDPRKGNEGNRKDDRNHSCLVNADRDSSLHPSSRTLVCIGNRDEAMRLCEEHHTNQKTNGENREENKRALLSRSRHKHVTECGRNTGDYASEDDERNPIPNPLFRHHFSKPHEEECSRSNNRHRTKNAGERGINQATAKLGCAGVEE